MNTPISSFLLGTLKVLPDAVMPLNSASLRFFPIPRTSPVDFISGPRYEFASISFSNENTGTFTAKYGGVL